MAENDKTVSDVMTDSPKTVSTDDTVVDAAKAMAENDFGAVPVVDGDDLKGILTDRDIVLRVVAEGKDPSDVKVGDVATTDDLATVEPDASIEDAVKRMKEKDVRRVVVTEDAKPVGIVSLGDLAAKVNEDSVLGDISEAAPNN